MAANYNKVILMGNLTRDPELRYTPKGTPVVRFGLAVNRTWRDESGQSVSDVLFVDVDAFGSQAEVINQYLRKGNPLFLEGRLKLDTWEDKQTGQRRSRMSVVMEAFQFLASRQDNSSDQGSGGGYSGGGSYTPHAQQQQSYGESRGGNSAPYQGGAPRQSGAAPRTSPSNPPSMDDASQDDDVPF
jgi:single-strand DNA-binding protein